MKYRDSPPREERTSFEFYDNRNNDSVLVSSSWDFTITQLKVSLKGLTFDLYINNRDHDQTSFSSLIF